MDSETRENISRLVATVTSTSDGRQFRKARRELERAPATAVVLALAERVQTAEDAKAYDRAAKLLAEWGGNEAAEILSREARSQRRFPRLAVRALSLCDHPSVVPVLLDLLEFSPKIKQRRAAAYALARKRSGRAILPLCRAAAKGTRDIGPDTVEALRKMGNTFELARAVLAEPELTVTQRVISLAALEEVHPRLHQLWWTTRFDAGRFLEREAANRRSPLQDEATRVADLWRMKETLLRPLEECADSSVLLRASGGAGDSTRETLLRASEEDEGEPVRRRFPFLSLLLSPARTLLALMRR